eukprot:tig00021493_g21850.t1
MVGGPQGENRRSSIAFAAVPEGSPLAASRRGSVMAAQGRRPSLMRPARTAAATSAGGGAAGGPGPGGAGRRYSRREVLELKRIFDSIDWSGGGTPLVADVLRALDSAADLAIRRLAEGLLERLQAKGSVASEQETLTFHQLIYALYPSLLKYEYEFIFSWTRPRVRERKKARPLTSEEKAEIAEIFGLYDRNGDGSLSLEEFVEAMQRTGIPRTSSSSATPAPRPRPAPPRLTGTRQDVYYCHDLDHNSVISLSECPTPTSAPRSSSAPWPASQRPRPPRLS